MNPGLIYRSIIFIAVLVKMAGFPSIWEMHVKSLI